MKGPRGPPFCATGTSRFARFESSAVVQYEMGRNKGKRKTSEAAFNDTDGCKKSCNDRGSTNNDNADADMDIDESQEQGNKRDTTHVSRTDDVNNNKDNRPHNEHRWYKLNGRWQNDNTLSGNGGYVDRYDNTGFTTKHRGDIKVIAALDTAKSTRDATENCFKITNLIRKDNIKPRTIKKVGISRIEMLFSDITKANQCFNVKFTQNSRRGGVRFYVDRSTMRCKGVVHGWPHSDTVYDFIMNVDDTEFIEEVERPLKRVYNKSTQAVEWQHMGILMVTFVGNKLPDSLSLYDGLLHVRVKHYIPEVRQCYNCYGYGHFKKFCRIRKKCVVCGLDFHDQCDIEAKCINCGKGHKAVDKQCPVYIQQKEANMLVAKEGVTFYEARRRVYTLHKIQTRHTAPSYAAALTSNNQSNYNAQTRHNSGEQTNNGSPTASRLVHSTKDAPIQIDTTNDFMVLVQKVDRLLDMFQMFLTKFTEGHNMFHRNHDTCSPQSTDMVTMVEILNQDETTNGDDNTAHLQTVVEVSDTTIGLQVSDESLHQCEDEAEQVHPNEQAHESTFEQELTNIRNSPFADKRYCLAIDPIDMNLPDDDGSLDYVAEADSDGDNT